MTFRFSSEYNPDNLDAKTLMGIDYAFSTLAVCDETNKTYTSLPLSQFLHSNRAGFDAFETFELIATVLQGEVYEIKAELGQVYKIFLIDVCRNDPEVFDFVAIERDEDPLAPYRFIEPDLYDDQPLQPII